MIVIIDNDTCNLKSVANAFSILGEDVIISNQIPDLINAERIVLPGVGSFKFGMENLHKLKLIETLQNAVIVERKPFLGICLGMQLLATTGHEMGNTSGLNWIGGVVKKFEKNPKFCKIPHIGWDDIIIKKQTTLFNGIQNNRDFYFVHSYYFVPESEDYVVATCDSGIEFAAALQRENIFAVQFHPEKSQRNGIKFLKNFINWNP